MVKKIEVSDSKREAILQMLLSHSTDRVLKYGTIKKTAEKFSLSCKTISRIWKRALDSSSDPCVPMNVASKKNMRGRKKIDYSPQIKKMSSVDIRKRTTLRSTSASINVPTTSLFRRMKDGEVKRKSSYMKPILSKKIWNQGCLFIEFFR